MSCDIKLRNISILCSSLAVLLSLAIKADQSQSLLTHVKFILCISPLKGIHPQKNCSRALEATVQMKICHSVCRLYFPKIIIASPVSHAFLQCYLFLFPIKKWSLTPLPQQTYMRPLPPPEDNCDFQGLVIKPMQLWPCAGILVAGVLSHHIRSPTSPRMHAKQSIVKGSSHLS